MNNRGVMHHVGLAYFYRFLFALDVGEREREGLRGLKNITSELGRGLLATLSPVLFLQLFFFFVTRLAMAPRRHRISTLP